MRPTVDALSVDAVRERLAELPGWQFDGDRLVRTYSFASFKEALGFIVAVGLCAEEQGHHPELTNVYSTVTLGLRTHDAGNKVTAKDFALAKAIQRLSWEPRRP
jgi:4a-hydroxytetrahydrobiopterin dehydratase